MAREKIGARKNGAVNPDSDFRVGIGDEHNLLAVIESGDPLNAPTLPGPQGLPFAAGNIVVYRVGDGSGALNGNATAVFLDEYTSAGVFVRTIAMPTVDSGANQTLTAVGTATSEGYLTLSADGRYLVLTGYDAAVGTTTPNTMASSTIARVIGRVGTDGVVDTSTALGTNGFSANTIRSVASSDGQTFWAVGANVGVVTAALGATSGTIVSSTATNLRSVGIFDGQLYIGSGAGTIRMGAVGSGLPTTTGQTTTSLAGFPTASNQSNQFYFADLTASVAGVDTLYIADDRASGSGGGLLKYSLVSGSWTLNGTVVGSLRGLTASTNGTTVTFFATDTTASANHIVTIVDTSGYNVNFSSSTLTTIATAATNTVFRGIAFAPTAGALSINDVTAAEGNSGTTNFTFTVTRTGGSSGAVSATWTLTLAGTADAADFSPASQSGTVSFAAGETSKQIVITVAGDVVFEGNETFSVVLSNVTGGATISDANGDGTITNDDAAMPVVTNLQDDVVHYHGGDGAVVLDTGTAALVSDQDSANFEGGLLSVSITQNDVPADDVLSVVNNPGTTQISGGNILVGGIVIGTVSGGTLGSPLTFFFNDQATLARVQILMRALTYENTNATPDTATRQITYSFAGPMGSTSVTSQVDFPGTLAMSADTNDFEGNGGQTSLFFIVQRTGGSTGTVSATWTLTLSGTADSTDFDPFPQTGTVTFADGEETKSIEIFVHGDLDLEADETFSVVLSAPTGGATISDNTAQGIIQNDDVAANQPPVVSNLDGDVVNFSENGVPALLDINAPATVSDADSADFDGGSLQVDVVSQQAAEEILLVTLFSNVTVVGSDVKLSGTTFGTITQSGPGQALIITFNANATPDAVTELLACLAYRTTSDDPAAGARSVGYTLTDGDGGSASGSVTVNVTAVNDAPAISGISGDVVTYIENQAFVTLDAPGVLGSVSDPDSANFAGGSLQVGILTGGTADDEFFVRNTGTIQVSGSDILVSGIPIGQITDSGPGHVLTIDLTINAIPAFVAFLLQAIAYRNASDTPPGGNRQVTWTLDDGDGGTGTALSTVTVVPVPDQSRVDLGGPGISNIAAFYSEDGAGIAIAENNVSINSIEGGVTAVTVTILNFQAGDELFGVSLGTADADLSFDFATPGTVHITGTGAATTADFEYALTLIRFRHIGEVLTDQARFVGVTVTDAAGPGSESGASITMLAVNDAPVLGGIDGDTVTYVENAAFVLLDGSAVLASVSDPDNATFNGGSLTITPDTARVQDDYFIVASADVSVSGSNVIVQGQTIGQIVGDGLGGNTLFITFNTFATAARVTLLLQQIAYSNNAGDNPTDGDRALTWVLNDGQGGQDVATSTVHVQSVDDAAIITGSRTGTVFEDGSNAQQNLNGQVIVTDPDSDTSFTFAQGQTASGYGFFTIAADGQWAYSLENGQPFVQSLGQGVTATDQFTVTTNGGEVVTFTFTITGRNDIPDVSQINQDFVQEDGPQLVGDGHVTVTDVDTGESGLQAQSNVTGSAGFGVFDVLATGDWTYTLDNAVAQALGAGAVVNDTITVTTIDGSTNIIITVSVFGRNDAATIGGVNSGDVTEDGTLVATGQLTISDVDNGENQLVPQTMLGGNGFGGFVVNADGSWTYTLNNNNGAIQLLNSGQTATDFITVTSADGTDTETINVTIHGQDEGANVPPTVDQGVADHHSGEDSQVLYTFSPDAFADADMDPLNYSATLDTGAPLPLWLSFDSGTRTFTGTPPQDFNGTLHIRVTASDGTGSVFDDFDLVIDPVNDAPDGADGSINFYEDSVLVLNDILFFGFTDVENDDFAGVWIDSVSGSGSFTLSGNPLTTPVFVSAAQIASGALVFTPAPNVSGNGYAQFTYRVTDDGGTANGGSDTDPVANTRIINVLPVNDAPVFGNLDGTPTFVENGTPVVIDANATLTDIELAAAGNYDGSTLWVQRAGGVANAQDLFSFTGVNVNYVGSSVSGVITSNASGSMQAIATASRTGGAIFVMFNANATQADVNAVMRQLTYANSSDNPPASVQLAYVFTDGNGGAQGTGGAAFAFGSATVNITPVNDAPVNTVGGTVTVNEDTSIALTGVSIADVDGLPGDTYTVLLSVQHGALTIRTDVAGGITGANIIGGGQGTNGLTITGTLAQINATLAAANGLTYQGDLNFNGADSLRISSWEGVPSDGTSFTVPFVSASLTNGTSLVTGDVNGDGKLDLVYIGGVANQVGVRIGDGDGDFGATTSLAAGTTPSEVVLADVDGDGDLDIVSTDYASGGSSFGSVGVMLNNGSGSFGSYQVLASLQSPYDVVTGDVNGDGRLDIIVDRRDYGLVSVLLASGAPGSFAAPVTYNATTPNYTTGITLGDFNNDGRLDIIAFNQGLKAGGGNGTVTLLLNNGDGTFAAPVDIFSSATVQPYEGTTYDLNNDGNLDLVFANYTVNDGVTVMLGNGNGTFGTPTFYATLGDADQVVVGDINGDGIADIVTSNGATGSLALFLGNGDGSFQSRVNLSISSSYAETPVLGDFNGDGRLDIAVNGAAGSGQRVLLNTGTWRGDTDTRTITVNSVNDAPSGTDKTVTFNEDSTYTFTAADFGYSDTADGNAFYSVIITTTPVNGTLTLFGIPVFDGQEVLVADLASLVFTPAPNANGNGYASFTFQVRDDGGSTLGGVDIDQSPNTFTLNVAAVNDAPGGVDGSINFYEDATLVLNDVSYFGFSDPDGNNFAGVWIDSVSGNGSFTFNGNPVTTPVFVSAAQIAAGLLVFTPAPNANGNNYAGFTYRVTDDGGTANGGVDTDPTPNTRIINVLPINDAPVNSVPGAQSVAEDGTLVLSGASAIQVADVDASTLQVTLSATNGTLTLAGVGGLVFTIGDGTGDATMTFSGTVAAINAALNGLSYAPAPDYNGPAQISVTTSDLGTTGLGGTLTDSDTIAVNVTAVNDAPVNSVPGSTQNVNEDGALVLNTANGNAIQISDVDAGAGNVTVTLSVSHGVLTVAVVGGLSYVNNGTASVIISGSVADINTALGTALTYAPAANYNGPDTIQVATSDGGNTGSGGVLTDTDSVAINVVSINDAPSGTDKTVTINEDGTYTFATADFGFTDPNDTPANTLLAVTFTTLATNGTLLYDADGVGGNAPVAVTLGQSILASEIALGKVTFVPTLNASGSPLSSFTFQVQDNGGTTNSGVDLDQSANTFTFNVSAVNDAPTISTSHNASLPEDTPIIFNGATSIQVADIDATSLTVTLSVSHGLLSLGNIAGLSFSVGDGTSDATMTFSGTIAAINAALASGLTYVPATNYNGADAVSIQVTDNGQTGSGPVGTASDSIALTVLSVNDAPAGTDKTLTGSEDDPVVFTAADFGLTDVNDSPANTLLAVKITTLPAVGTLFLDPDGVGGPNPGVAVSIGQFISLADINAGHLYFLGALDGFGSPYASFTFQVQDNGGTIDLGVDLDQSANVMTINLTPDNLPPAVDLNGPGAGINHSTTFVEDGIAVAIGSGITITDPDSGIGDLIESAKVTLTDRVAGDSLTFSTPLPMGFTAAFTNAAGSITIDISGTGTAAQYQAILQSIVYATTNQDPTVGGTDTQRTITVTVNDGLADSAVATTTINITPVDDLPVAYPDAFTFTESQVVTGANLFTDHGSGADSDPDGPALSVSAVNGSALNVGTQISLASGALLKVNTNGTFDYDPNGAFLTTPTPGSGASNTPAHDSFTYTVTGGNTVTVTLTLTGLDTDDILLGTAGNDVMFAGVGTDTLTGGAGDDVLDGGAGTDTALFTATNLSFTSTAIGWAVVSAEGNELLQRTEITVSGNGARNLLVGGTAFGSIQAAFDAAINNDTVRLANATYTGTSIYADAGLTVIAQPGAVLNVTFSTPGTDGIVVVAAGGADTITTGAGNDVLYGNGGTDTLNGGGGADFLDGGSGADVMAGGSGNDSYIVDMAGDVVTEAVGNGYDVVFSAGSYALAAGSEVEGLVALDFNGTAAINFTGNEFANYLIGNAGANTLNGGAGADILEGRGGDDTYIVDNAGDLVIEATGQGFDVVFTSASYQLNDVCEVEGLSTLDWNSTAALDLTGNALGNYMIGNDGANVMDGGAGNDVMYGRGGADIFVFADTLGAGNVDYLADFNAADDTIQLSHYVFTGLGTGALDPNAFWAGSAAHDADDRIIYNQATGQLWFDADGNGAGAAVLFANLAGNPVLTASDFVVI